MSIRIVTHCYAAQQPHFAHLLRYQLSSLLVYRPRNVCVTAEVVCTAGDVAVASVLDDFADDIHLHTQYLPPGRLWRRSIGRNAAALASSEELVWFCDADYVFGEGCLDTLWEFYRTYRGGDYGMLYPASVLISADHATGDAAAAVAGSGGRLAVVEPDEYVRQAYSRAIGGAQIVKGSLARRVGYLGNRRRYTQPCSSPFPDFRDDVAARNQYRPYGPMLPVELPELYRIRHSTSSYRDRP